MFSRKRLSEKALFDALKSGNEDALIQLYQDNYTTVRNYVIRNNGKPEDAEDVLQEAVMVVWENVRRKGFELTAKLSTFLLAIAKRMWLKKLNKNMRIEYNDERVLAHVEIYQPDFMNEKLEFVREAVESLDEGCRELLTLFYFRDMNMQRIAEKMKFANTDVVKSRKYQCFKKLQTLFTGRFSKSDFLE